MAQDPAESADRGDQLLTEAYDEMRRVARRRVLQLGIHSIQATELVNETYLKLAGQDRDWENRHHLFFLAGRAMRDILVERARQKASLKRGGDWTRVTWETAVQVAGDHPEELLMLDEALSRLSSESPELAQIVEMLFFAGFTGEETAAALGVSPSTIDRRWKFAKAWLHNQLVSS